MLLENTPQTVGFQSFLQLCHQALECPTTNSQGSRFLCDIPQTSHISPVFWLTLSADSLCTVTFHVFPRLFLSFYLFSFSFEKNNLLQRSEHSSQWNQALQKWTSSLSTSSLFWLLSAEEKEEDTYTHNWRFVTKNDEIVAPCRKTECENLTGKTAAVLCNVLLFVVLWYEEERSWCLNGENCVEKTIVDLMSVHR